MTVASAIAGITRLHAGSVPDRGGVQQKRWSAGGRASFELRLDRYATHGTGNTEVRKREFETMHASAEPGALAGRPARARITDLRTSAYRVPTHSGPESDGTIEWNGTTIVLAEVDAGGERGLGFSYTDRSACGVIADVLREAVVGADVVMHGRIWTEMGARVRNLGRGGIASTAISAVDVALWDLRGKLLKVPVAALLGSTREEVPVYGSGGFTSYDARRLCAQMEGWVDAGIPAVKMKVGREPERDVERVSAVRMAIGPDAQLFVDANGAYSCKQALAFADAFRDARVTWFEEPVAHRDLTGLRAVRSSLPPGMELASGEYGYELHDFAEMVEAGAVDVLQADATRCGGFTGLLAVDGLCQTTYVPLSTHCAPYLHLHAAAAAKTLRHMEYFFDHVRIERMFFDGVAEPRDGAIAIDWDRPGIGLELKHADVARFAL
jgi:L-alanine-DL-glutamate epimerase-like enolase superfamily enzyme